MNVLVVGAGIGGLTTAIALGRDGHRVTVLERQAHFAPLGAGITLAPNAARVLATLGVDVAAVGHELTAMDVVRADGRVLQRIDPRRADPGFGPIWALTRPALHDALHAALPPGVEVITGRAVAALDEDRGGVAVDVLPDRRFDLVIGAEGVRSPVRTAIAGARRIQRGTVEVLGGVIANPGFDRALEAWGGAARIGVVPLRDDQLYYFLVLTAPPRAPAPRWPDGFAAAFGHLRGGVERLLTALPAAPPLHHDLEELDRPVWGRDRVALLGDAAHAMTPNLGQGACQAIEDAVVLARALRGASDVPAALRDYAARRIGRTSAIARQSHQVGQVGQWESPLACELRDWLARRLLPRLQQRQIARLVEHQV